MKKGLSIILAFITCFVLIGSAAAEAASKEESFVNETTTINSEPAATNKKSETAESTTKAGGSSPTTGDLLRFVPTTIDVSTNKVVVEGYFINLSSYTVSNFEDFNMDVYLEGSSLISGYFGRINQFSVYPGSTKYQTFTFNGAHNLNPGFYVCDDRCYCVVSFDFTFR